MDQSSDLYKAALAVRGEAICEAQAAKEAAESLAWRQFSKALSEAYRVFDIAVAVSERVDQ